MENPENPENKIEENVVEPVVKKKKKKINRYCSIPECKTRVGGTMHRFPKDMVLRKKWIKACKFKKVITDNTTICNNHFLPTDFIPRMYSFFNLYYKIHDYTVVFFLLAYRLCCVCLFIFDPGFAT